VATYKLPVAMDDFCAAEFCFLAREGSADNSSLSETLLSETLVFPLSLGLLALLDFFFFFFFFFVFFFSSDSLLESSVSAFFLLWPGCSLR
jgi:hypothetical protein